MRVIWMAAAMAWPAAVAAQESAPAFTGGYAGPEIGLHEHHIYFEITDLATGDTQGRYYRGWGVGGGAFAGYDLAVTPRVRLGVEAGVSLGGTGPSARFPDGSRFDERPRYGLRGTGRVGYLLTQQLMAYGTLGYGGHRYRILAGAQIDGVGEWGSSFTVGGGLEYRASRRLGLRIDFRHLDNQMSHLLVGLPIRF